MALTIVTRPGRDTELRELRIGETLSQAPEPSPEQLDSAIACLEASLTRLHALRALGLLTLRVAAARYSWYHQHICT